MDVHITSEKKDSILKCFMERLEEIKTDKCWSMEKTGKDFAELLIKEPVPAPRADYFDEDDYYDEVHADPYAQMAGPFS